MTMSVVLPDRTECLKLPKQKETVFRLNWEREKNMKMRENALFCSILEYVNIFSSYKKCQIEMLNIFCDLSFLSILHNTAT